MKGMQTTLCVTWTLECIQAKSEIQPLPPRAMTGVEIARNAEPVGLGELAQKLGIDEKELPP